MFLHNYACLAIILGLYLFSYFFSKLRMEAMTQEDFAPSGAYTWCYARWLAGMNGHIENGANGVWKRKYDVPAKNNIKTYNVMLLFSGTQLSNFEMGARPHL